MSASTCSVINAVLMYVIGTLYAPCMLFARLARPLQALRMPEYRKSQFKRSPYQRVPQPVH